MSGLRIFILAATLLTASSLPAITVPQFLCRLITFNVWKTDNRPSSELIHQIAIAQETHRQLLLNPPAGKARSLVGVVDSYQNKLHHAEQEIAKLQNTLARRREGYYVIPMGARYNAEHVGLMNDLQQHEEKQRARYLLLKDQVDDFEVHVDSKGLLRTHQGQLLDTDQLKGKLARFVMTADGRIYATSNSHPEPDIGNSIFRHSSFFCGLPVAAAGEFIVHKGKMVLVNRKSGHYQPTQFHLQQFLSELQKRNVNVTEIKLEKGY